MKNELQVKVNQKLGIIDFNYEEMKQELSEKMEQYNDIVVTADTKTVAKKDVAELRKLKKELNDRRIKVKKEYDKPYDEFKSKVDELTGLIDEPIDLIDKQVKAFEEREKEEKKKEIEELYSELIGDNEQYLPLKKIYNKRWENVSFSIKEIEKEIKESVDGVDLAVTTIKGMNSEVEDKALALFKDDLSLANAITYINKHEQMKAEILAKEQARRKEEDDRKRREEEERIKAEERKRVAEEARIREEARQQALEEQRTKEEKEKEVETVEHVEDIEPAAAAEIDILGMLPFLEEEEEEYIEDKYIYTIEIIATAQEFDELLKHLDSREIKTEVLE